MTIEAIQKQCMCIEIGRGVDKLRLRWVYFWQKYHNSIKDTKTLLRGATLVERIFKNIFQSCILETCEHFSELWAFFRVVSIFQCCEHFSELCAFFRVVCILESCEDFGQLWAFWRVVSILEGYEHFPELWTSPELWELAVLACICKSCKVVKILIIYIMFSE